MTNFCQTAIIGAGPYGLSLAAHLAAAGADFRIFGKPLTTWRDHMPEGMLLKSDGFASNLFAPNPDTSLKAWCARQDVAYQDKGNPIALATFVAYSAWFQRTQVPMLEDAQVIALSRTDKGFLLRLDSGETLEAARVVLAVGISWFKNMPDQLAGLPEALASHSYDHHDLSPFAGKRVLILGAGSSAVDTAVMAHAAGAQVTLLARAHHIFYHAIPDGDASSWLRALTHPSSGIGPGWRSFFCANAPRLFRRLPEPIRLKATRRHLGPAPGWFMRGKLVAQCHMGHEIEQARPHHGRVLVTAHDGDGKGVELVVDHVIAATGYRPDLRRLPFLDGALRTRIAQVENTPHLSDNFETSVPGLYVMGPLAANTFGPLMRFMVGAEYAAPRIAQHLMKRAARLPRRRVNLVA